MILDLIKSRRAVYPVQYNDASISEEEIHKILEAAN
jgi:nitroreductase